MSSKRGEPSSSHDQPDSKKVRFDARNPSNLVADAADDEEDAILGLDTIGKGHGAAKHSAVNLDGFESDSDDDNFNVRAAERAKAKKRASEKQDEDEDMFGESDKDDEDDPDLAVKKKKTVNFIDERDIEGQIKNSTSGSKSFDLRDSKGKVKDEESDSESGGDEGRDQLGSDIDEELGAGAKKKHAPKIDAFNMTAEGEEGKFDESGNFVRARQDANAMHDSWLEGISKKEMKKAKDAEEKREEERRKKNLEQDSLLESDLLSTLISHLEIGESILEALQRLAKAKPKTKPKHKKHKQANGDAMDVENGVTAEDPAETARKAAVDAITGAADALLTRGQEHIYDQEREVLMRQYKRETGEDWTDKTKSSRAGSDQWHFRWIDKRDGGSLNGPYDSATIKSWVDAGYFGDNVEYQQIGTDDWVKSIPSL